MINLRHENEEESEHSVSQHLLVFVVCKSCKNILNGVEIASFYWGMFCRLVPDAVLIKLGWEYDTTTF